MKSKNLASEDRLFWWVLSAITFFPPLALLPIPLLPNDGQLMLFLFPIIIAITAALPIAATVAIVITAIGARFKAKSLVLLGLASLFANAAALAYILVNSH
ncbi:hypothetical protein BH11ARM1_BH11ARM1_09400 [soil metagenome]